MYTFTCELYNQVFYFAPGMSKKKLVKKLIKLGLNYNMELDLKNNSGYMLDISTKKKQAYLIWIKDDSKESLSFLSHECIHAAIACLKARGVRLHASNDEPLCYLTQWIFGACLENMKVK